MRNKIITLVALFLLLRLEGEGFKDLGLSSQNWPKHLARWFGLWLGDVHRVECRAQLDHDTRSCLDRRRAGRRSSFIFKEPRNLLAWLPIGIFGGGVVEELQRIFIFTRFEKWLGRPGLILGIVLSSMMFGLGHRYQGTGIAISTTFVRSDLRTRLSAPALRSRADHCARLQRRPRHARRDDASEVTSRRDVAVRLASEPLFAKPP